MQREELKYWLGFSRFGKLSLPQLKQLAKNFPTIQEAWQANQKELEHAGLKPKTAEGFTIQRSQIDLNKEIDNLEKENIQVVALSEEDYPSLLKEIPTPPAILFYKGNIKAWTKQTLAIVGTRKFSNYGKQVTIELTQQITDQNLQIVSGLALGIDTLAHSTCVRKQTPNFAVLGSGLNKNNIYPKSNYYLAEQILSQGGIIFSEYPIGTIPFKQNFPARNRIISGLARGTLVIEAGQRSGSLITANFALDQNREVFAVPGPINHPNSIGTNQLIKRGAKAVTSVDDILEELNLVKIEKATKQIETNYQEDQILKHLSREPIHINQLLQVSQIKMSELNHILLTLEIKGKIKNLGNMNYISL